MKLVTCCCNWSYVIGRKKVYGPIWAAGLGEYPDLLNSTQRIMPRSRFEGDYADCAAHIAGKHRHPSEPHSAP